MDRVPLSAPPPSQEEGSRHLSACRCQNEGSRADVRKEGVLSLEAFPRALVVWWQVTALWSCRNMEMQWKRLDENHWIVWGGRSIVEGEEEEEEGRKREEGGRRGRWAHSMIICRAALREAGSDSCAAAFFLLFPLLVFPFPGSFPFLADSFGLCAAAFCRFGSSLQGLSKASDSWPSAPVVLSPSVQLCSGCASPPRPSAWF